MEVTTIKVAEELHSTPHDFMHWDEPGLLGNSKPTNQLVTKPGGCFKVIPDTLIEVFFLEMHIVGALFTHNDGPLCETDVMETLAHQAEQCWTIFLLNFGKSSNNL